MVLQVLGYFASSLPDELCTSLCYVYDYVGFFPRVLQSEYYFGQQTVGQNNTYQTNGRELYPTENITEYIVVCLCKILCAELPLFYP